MGIEAETSLKDRSKQGSSYDDMSSLRRKRTQKKSGLPL